MVYNALGAPGGETDTSTNSVGVDEAMVSRKGGREGEGGSEYVLELVWLDLSAPRLDMVVGPPFSDAKARGQDGCPRFCAKGTLKKPSKS